MLNMDTVKIGFIGYGNMSGATAAGLIRSGAVCAEQIYACAKNYEKLCERAEKEGIHPYETAVETVRTCDVIFVGVKPYMVEEVMKPLQEELNGKIVISLAAGLYHDDLSGFIPSAHTVATAPNTPVSVCEGIFICEEENSLSFEEKSFVEVLLENLGLVLWMDKTHMATAGTVIGCAPAFAAMFMEALGDAACKHGLTRQTAYPLIAQMLGGTGKMALESGSHPGQLKDAVCSPAGLTIEGVAALEKNGFRHAVIDAIDQIQNKAKSGNQSNRKK